MYILYIYMCVNDTNMKTLILNRLDMTRSIMLHEPVLGNINEPAVEAPTKKTNSMSRSA